MYRNEKSYYDSTKYFLLVHNYINWYLTGGEIAMEEGDASGTGIWDPVNKKWSKKVINLISEDLINKLPVVTSSTKSIGHISNSLAHQYGFDLECRIDAGSGDNMYGAVGTGNIDKGIVTNISYYFDPSRTGEESPVDPNSFLDIVPSPYIGTFV